MSLTPPPDLIADITKVLHTELGSKLHPALRERELDSAARAVAVLVVERAGAATQRAPA